MAELELSSSSFGSDVLRCNENELEPSFEESHSQEVRRMCNYYFTKWRRVFTAIAAFLGLFSIVLSFYGIIIMNLFFFASSMISYTLLPVYHGFCEDWLQFIFGIIQVIVNCPFIQFYMLFIIASVKKFIGIIPQSYHFLMMAYYWNKNEVNTYPKIPHEVWRRMQSDCKPLGFLVLSFFGIVLGGGLIWLLFFFAGGWGSIAPGVIVWIALVSSIILKVSPTYNHFVAVLMGSDPDLPCLARSYMYINRQNKILEDKYDSLDKENKNEGRGEQQIQTYESTLVGRVNEQVYLSESEYTSSYSGSDGKDVQMEEMRIEERRVAKDKQKIAAKKETEDTTKEESKQVWKDLLGIFLSEEYQQIYDLGLVIREDIFHATRNRNWLLIFLALNILVMVFDVYRILDSFNGYFMMSLVIRFIALPLTSYFHSLVVFFHGDSFSHTVSKWVMRIGSVFTWLVVAVSIGAVVYVKVVGTPTRITSMPPPTSPEMYSWNHNNLSAAVCSNFFDGMSVLDVASFSLGVYDIARDEKVFKTEMQHFFGADWEENIDYEVHWISKHVPVGVYDVKDRNTTVFAFRGFDTGQELAMQVELFAIHYVLPFIEDIMPLHEWLVDGFLKVYTIFAHTLGMHFFDPKLMIDDFVPPVLDLYDKLELYDKRNVIFVGSNVGGVLAKIAGMKLHRPALGFISFPAFNDFFQLTFDLENEMAVYITNVYNFEGLYTAQEPGLANNIGVPWVSTSFLDRDSIYQSFCTIVETCQMNARYEQFCHAAIGRRNMDLIREYFNEDVFLPGADGSS